MNKFIALTLSSLFVLVSCGGQDAPTGDDGEGDVVVEEAVSKGEVPFAEVGQSVMSSKFDQRTNEEGYTSYDFRDGEGTCFDDEGFMDEFAYYLDEDLGYFVSGGGDYTEKFTSLDFIGHIRFSDVPLTSGPAKCNITATSGENTAELECTRSEGEEVVDVCTGTFQVFASR